MSQEAIAWIMLVATACAVAAAIATWRQALAISKSTTSSNLINCLNAYIAIMRARTRALENKSEQQCKDFYRELFDLHWTEFQLWQEHMIPDHVMKAWLAVRRRNYNKDSLEFETETGHKVSVTYQQVWRELKEDIEYFEPTDPFIRFMDKAHTQVITDMQKLRGEFERK
jgi:hypothetical protein